MAALGKGSKCSSAKDRWRTPLFHHFAPPILGISQSSTCFLLNPNLIFEIGSKWQNNVLFSHEFSILNSQRPIKGSMAEFLEIL
jgi:hypothetical protein